MPIGKRLSVWIYVVCWLGTLGSVSAQECNFRSYSVADGLPQSQVNAIFQDQRGFVWLGTQGAGISRFDGKQFVNYSPASGLGSGVITSITGWDDQIWSGTSSGLYYFDKDHWIPSDSNLGVELEITALEPSDSTLWVGTRKGLARFIDGKLEKVVTRTGLDQSEIRVMLAEGDSLWVGTFRQGLFVITGNEKWWKVKPVGEALGLSGSKIRALVRDEEETLWVGTSGFGLFYQTNSEEKFTPFQPIDHNYSPFITSGVNAGNKEVWFGTWGGGIVRVKQGKVSNLKTENGLLENTVKSLFTDREKNVWVGSFASGFSIFLGESVKKFKTNHGLAGNNVRSFALDKSGGLWIATLDGLSQMEGGTFKEPLKGLENLSSRIGAVVSDSLGGIYIATYTGELHYLLNGKLRTLPQPKTRLTEILSLYLDSKGVLWVGTYKNGLYRYKNGWLPPLYGQDEYLTDAIWCFYESSGLYMYIGTERGVFRQKGDALEPFDIDPELERYRVNSIAGDKNHHLYFATNGLGMMAYDPAGQSYRYFTGGEGESSAHVFSVLVSEDDCLYLANLSGITKINISDFWSQEYTEFRHLGRADGLGGVEYNPNAIVTDAMGNIWFGSNMGAVCYHPQDDNSSMEPPKVQLTGVLLNQIPMDLSTFIDSAQSGNPFKFIMLEGSPQLSFHFANLIFRSEQVLQTEYRVLGMDSAWKVIDSEANLLELSPPDGEYVLEVRSKNSNNVGVSNQYYFSVGRDGVPSYWLLYLSLVMVFVIGLGGIFTINRTRTNNRMQFSGSRQEAFTGRLVGFVAIFAYPTSGYLFAVNDPVQFDDLIGHLLVGVFIGLLVLSSYLIKSLSHNVPALLKVGFLAVISHILFHIYYTDLHPNHVTGLFVVILGVTLALRSIKDTIVFSVYITIGASLVVFAVSDEPLFSPFLFMGALMLSITLSFVVIISRLNLFNRLTFSDNIVNQPNNLVMAVNQLGEVVFANPGVKELLGYDTEEVLGMGWWSIRSKDTEANADEFRATIDIAQNSWEGELARETVIQAKDGTDRTIFWVYSRLPDRTIVGMGQDITSLKRARKDLHELSLVASKTDNYVIITGADDRISWVNRGFTTITGFELEEIKGKMPSEVLRGPVTPEDQVASIQSQVEKGLPFREEVLNVRKDGSPIWLSLNVTPVMDPYGNLEKYITIGSDITERKRSEQQLKFYAERLSFIHSIDRIILEAGSSLDLIYKINLGLYKQLNADRVCLVLFDDNKELGQLVSIQSPNACIVIEEDVALNELMNLETFLSQSAKAFSSLSEIGLQDSHPFWTAHHEVNGGILCPLIFHKETIGFMLLEKFPDSQIGIGELELVEEVVSQMAAFIVQSRLQETVRRSNVALERRNHDIAEINSELRQFAHVVSHDLKAPLRAIGSLSSWIMEENHDRMTEDGKSQMGLLTGRVKRMNDLIEGILAYSKLGQKRELQGVIDLEQLVNDLLPNFTGHSNTKIEIMNSLPVVRGEPTRIMQLFQNLIGNAVKYMDKEEGWVRVGVTEDTGHWKFYIQDNGPGIDPKYHEKIFQIFQTLQSRDDRESTGVGLSIVKKIVELHEGRVWVESELGVGTTFHFTLVK